MAKTAAQEIVFLDGTRYGERGLRRLDQTIQMHYDEQRISPRSCGGILGIVPEPERRKILDWIEVVAGAPSMDVDLWITRLVVHVAHQRRVDVDLLIREIRKRQTAKHTLLPTRCFA